ncbi:fimbrial protein [Chimaeribacter californicus]|uniref:Fimbrial protein n=1 Tax=Chimaeribacter californicus TaxID=2060067 RepID=A0A2N5EA94_9GAMM|nr:fimbrial protein [Chimaeribacter californicus]PLR38825.1 fimbrial protein [Chimaeribacter californicus]
MKNISILVSAGIFCLGLAAPALAGTDNVKMTFESVIEAGTCTAQIQNGAGTAISELNFGDVYKSDLSANSRVEPFKLVFSGCSGVVKANYTAKPSAGSGCSGPGADGPSFSGTGTATAVAVELWKGDAGDGTALACNTLPPQNVRISGGGASVSMNARMVIAYQRTIADVVAGDTSIPVTFAVTYE